MHKESIYLIILVVIARINPHPWITFCKNHDKKDPISLIASIILEFLNLNLQIVYIFLNIISRRCEPIEYFRHNPHVFLIVSWPYAMSLSKWKNLSVMIIVSFSGTSDYGTMKILLNYK